MFRSHGNLQWNIERTYFDPSSSFEACLSCLLSRPCNFCWVNQGAADISDYFSDKHEVWVGLANTFSAYTCRLPTRENANHIEQGSFSYYSESVYRWGQHTKIHRKINRKLIVLNDVAFALGLIHPIDNLSYGLTGTKIPSLENLIRVCII